MSAHPTSSDSAKPEDSAPPQLPVAVVTVTFSPGEHLAAMLDSLSAATAGETYVIMADNGSVDGAPQRAVSAQVELLQTGGNLGYGAAMNMGVARARELAAAGAVDPNFIVLSNPDVVFHPGSIDHLIRCAQQRPRAGAIGPRIVEADGSVYPSARAVPQLGTGIGHALLADLWPANPWSAAYRAQSDMSRTRVAGWLSGSCLLLRTEAFAAVGGFDERYFMYLEDVDLGDRLSRAGWENIFCVDAAISHAQGHSTAAHSLTMLSAHHDSAYRFLADRYHRWYHAPLRWVLRAGLAGRLWVLSRGARRDNA